MKALLAALLLATASPVLAQNSQPITRQGPSCLLGYYSQAGYCVPSTGVGRTNQAIPKAGSTCPLGWYSQGAYCTRQLR